MKIEVFESGCCKSGNLYDMVVRADSESGMGAEVTRFAASLGGDKS